MVDSRPIVIAGWIAKLGSAFWATVILLWVLATGTWGLGGGATFLFCLAVIIAAAIDVARAVQERRRLEAEHRLMAARLRGGK